MKIAYMITDPYFGTNILALPGETPLQAVARYNLIRGWDPGAADFPVAFGFNPRWTTLVSASQLERDKGVVDYLRDPDTQESITVEDYITNLPEYQKRRESPFPVGGLLP